MHLSAHVAAWIAIGAAAAAAAAVVFAFLLWLKLRRVRAGQNVLLGGGKADLVDFAVSLQGRIDDLHRAVDEIAAGLARVDQRIDGSLAKTALVRYDAYKDAGGRGFLRSSIETSCGSRFPLRRLQGAHEVTTFSQTDSPPRLFGTTWSRVSRPPALPQ